MSTDNLPDVTFAAKDIDTILNDMISGYEQAYYNQTGEIKKLYPGDPIRIFLYSQALRELQLRQIIDYSAKQNLLKYAVGDFLKLKGDGLAKKLEAEKAIVTEKFIFSAVLSTNQTIPKGTRVGPGNDVYFETIEDIPATAGLTELSVTMTCTVAGTIGNGYISGQINVLVDPLPWVASVTNTDTSSKGTDEEDDDSYRERIRLAPESFSVAGPSGAYEFFAKEYSSAVKDVKISTPSACVVDIRILLQNGEIPTSAFLQEVENYLSDKKKRPLTDNVSVSAPDIISYDIELTYYILSDNATSETSIKASIESAVQEYIIWQKSKIGRDINQSELVSRIIQAGAKRVNIVNPVYIAITDTQVAVASTLSVIYGGLEDA